MSKRVRRESTTLPVEPLERRLLWAADLTPGCINGLVINLDIAQTTGDYSPTSGAFQFRPSADDDSFTMQGALTASGTFRFQPWSDTRAHFDALDATTFNGNQPSVVLTFSSATAGTFELNALNFYQGFEGTMSGTFEITGTSTPLAVLSDGILTVTGTVGWCSCSA